MFLHHGDASQYDLVIFMDHAHAHHLPRVLPPNMIVQEIDEVYMHDHSPLWQRMGREQAIMASEAYQAIEGLKRSPGDFPMTFCHVLQFPRPSHTCFTTFIATHAAVFE